MAAAGRLAARTTVDRDEADPLTSREREAAALLDQALSNRQIAGRLVLSERTVESRMRGILTKTQCAKPDRVRGSVEPVMSMATAAVYSAWIQPTKSSRLTVSSRAGWSAAMCPRIIPTTWSSLSPRATNPHSHRISFIAAPPALAVLPA